ncbi:hypothetical protein [Lentzea sp. NPDC055074]
MRITCDFTVLTSAGHLDSDLRELRLEHVALTATFYSRADLVHVPIEDIAPNEVALVWAEHRQTPLLAEFTATALQG